MAPDQVPVVAVPRHDAEAVRRHLMGAALLSRTHQPSGDGGVVLFPLARPVNETDVQGIRALSADAHFHSAALEPRPSRPDSYRDLLTDLPAKIREQLPTAFDIVGDIAVIKLYPEMEPYRDRIASALLQTHKRIHTVAQDRGVQGDLRVRALEPLAARAGAPRLDTVHREHGLDIYVPLDKAYFSPRLATERARLAARIRAGDKVIDLFAGVGALVCLMIRDRGPQQVIAVDLNADAVAALRRNLDTNRIDQERVSVHEGDARTLGPRLADHDQDHVIMNLPHGAAEFLDVAAECVAPDGEVHLYAMVADEERVAFEERVVGDMTRFTGRPWRVLECRHVRTYAPTIQGLAFTLGADPNA